VGSSHTNSDTYCNTESYSDTDIYAYSDANCHGNSYTKTRPDPKTSAHSTAPPQPAVSASSIGKSTNRDQESCG